MKLIDYIDLFIIDHGWIRALLNNNFYRIDDGVYRSGQPSPRLLKSYVVNYKIKTIVNLRKPIDSEKSIFLLQKKICNSYNLSMVNIPFSARKLPNRETLKLMIEAIKEIELPFLVHCKTGADRTGFFMALYQFYKTNEILEAKKQLSLKYLHIKYSSTGVLDYFFEKIDNLNLDNSNLEQWVEENYNPDQISKEYYKIKKNKNY